MNAYRVLLTRARQGLIIYIPKGNSSDATTLPQYYDGTFNYLRELGIEEVIYKNKCIQMFIIQVM